MRTALRFKMHGEHSLGRRLFSTYFCRRCSPFFGSKHAHRAGETVTHHASTRPTTMCPASRTLAVTATLAVLANLLKGCAETEDDGVVASPRFGIVPCFWKMNQERLSEGISFFRVLQPLLPLLFLGIKKWNLKEEPNTKSPRMGCRILNLII